MEGERSTRNMVTVYLGTMHQPRVQIIKGEALHRRVLQA